MRRVAFSNYQNIGETISDRTAILRAAECEYTWSAKNVLNRQLRKTYVVASTGLEPVSPLGRRILSPLCIPIPPRGQKLTAPHVTHTSRLT